MLLYDPYGPPRAFIAKVLRKSPNEGRTWWREQVRKRPFGPARIAYGLNTRILSVVRARCELKQLCCYINPDFSVKMSNIPNFVTRGKKEWKKEKRGGHIIIIGTRSWRTDLATLGPYAMTSGQIFSRPARPNSVNKYIILTDATHCLTAGNYQRYRKHNPTY